MGDGTGFDDVLLGLPGFVVTAVTENGDEVLIGIETIRAAAGCPSCGVIARTKDRLRVVYRDLPAFDRLVRLVWSKRRFFCPEEDCPQRTWTEPCESSRIARYSPLVRCASARVPSAKRPARSPRSPGVAWGTVMAAKSREVV